MPSATFNGAHPTMREFADLLQRWRFKPAGQRNSDRHHVTLRGPHGGRIQILASLQGRAHVDQIARAARLAHVSVDAFLTGPASADSTAAGAAPAPQPTVRKMAHAPAGPQPASADTSTSTRRQTAAASPLPGLTQNFCPELEAPASTAPVEELFARIFPHGVRVTPDLLHDLQQWTELTRTLAAHTENPSQ